MCRSSVHSWPVLELFLGIIPEPKLWGMGMRLLQLGRNKESLTQLGAASFAKSGCKNLIGIKNALICAQNLSCNVDNASKMVIVGTEWRSIILLDNWNKIPKPKKGAYI